MDWFRSQYKTNVETNRKRSSLSTDRKLYGTRTLKCNHNKSSDHRGKYTGYAINIPKIALLLLLSPTSVLANAVSQSNTGSVTNQNYNVNNVNFHTNQYGGNIVCQGPMMNITPFSTFNTNFQKPFDHRYRTPVYDPTDLVGDFDDDGNPIGDGDVDEDSRGEILYYEKVRTGMRSSNTSINGGITATWSIPLDRTAIRECRKAMAKQNELYESSLAANRLNYEMSRAKTCADNFKNGFRFKLGTPMAKICEEKK